MKMDTLLDALQEGRLIELPENNKEHSLQFLAHILEAIPSVPTGTDVVGAVLERERTTTTALGKGWACPHARVPFDEDLMCVVGWSPEGIKYGAPDQVGVSVIAMYLVPANQRNHYLREISLLAKALTTYADVERMRTAKDLDDVRGYLLDLISITKETVGPDTRVRMIQLQARQSRDEKPSRDLSNLTIEPVSIISGSVLGHIVLAQDAELQRALDGATGIVKELDSIGAFRISGWQVVKRGVTVYQAGRAVYDCLAIRTTDERSGTAR